MTESPTELSARLIDESIVDVAPNRVTQRLSELDDDVALVESFSHVALVRTDEGLVAFDTSGQFTADQVVAAVRTWSDDPVHTIVYTHGHMDHIGGSAAFAADAEQRGHLAPRIIGHDKVAERMDRYELTSGYNLAVNLRQFAGMSQRAVREMDLSGPLRFLPPGTVRPDTTFDASLDVEVGGVDFALRHARGETDDHTWTWIPSKKMISAGDLFIWNFPNCGNPQKVQRYPREWVDVLRAMAAAGAELFVPAHGLPIAGQERIERCLTTVADVLEKLLGDVLDAMNTGAPLDEIIHSVSVDPAMLSLPFLRPLYDEPEFVIRNIWRLYGGWYDGKPAHLKPPSDAAIGAEVAALAGGTEVLAERARALADAGDHRLACQLIEFAADADPDNVETHRLRAEIYDLRRKAETSLMAKGIFGSAEAESITVSTGEAPPAKLSLGVGLTDID